MLDVVARAQPIHGGQPRGAGLPCPLLRAGDIGVLLGEPTAGLGQDGAVGGSDFRA
jgi:hypothetical protein